MSTLFINNLLSFFCFLSFGISLVVSFEDVFVISSAILLQIKSLVAFTVLSIALFQTVFVASVVDFLALSRSF